MGQADDYFRLTLPASERRSAARKRSRASSAGDAQAEHEALILQLRDSHNAVIYEDPIPIEPAAGTIYREYVIDYPAGDDPAPKIMSRPGQAT